MSITWNKEHPKEMREATKRYYRRNTELVKAKARKHREELRLAALSHYGTKCACCDESRYAFLTIDHVVPPSSKTAYGKKALPAWLKKHGYPPGFQILCWNCQMGKAIYGVCPHAIE